MTSIVDNGNTSSMDMPQWKRDLIMRRRAQQAAALSKDNTVPTLTCATSVNKQLSGSGNLNQSKTVCGCCCNCGGVTSRIGGSPIAAVADTESELGSVALGCHPPLGHQPNSNSNNISRPSAGSVGSGRCCCSCCRNSSSCGTASSCGCATSSSPDSTSSSVVCSACKCIVGASSPSSSTTQKSRCSHSNCGDTTTCCNDCNKMVHLHNDSDSSEELQYGPGIVNKLKNRYLSLTLREATTKRRPSILRKSTSLENLLDDDYQNDHNNKCINGQQYPELIHDQDAQQLKQSHRLYETRTNGTNGNAKNVPSSNRYHRNAASTRGMKRARSVEAISRIWSPSTETSPPTQQQQAPSPTQQQQQQEQTNGRPKSFHEEFNFAINPIITPRINKPKRITPVITEREKPPADVVKQTKKIFESRPESRTRPPQHTGDVAAKVATYKTIIIQNKQQSTLTNKPPIKQKPTMNENENNKNANVVIRSKPNIRLNLKSGTGSNNTSPITSPVAAATNGIANIPATIKSLPSPIPDVSMVKEELDDKKTSSLSETPDLILHSSPVHVQKEHKTSSDDLIQAEISYTIKTEAINMEVVKPPSPMLTTAPASKTEPLTLDITTCKNTISANNKDPVLVLSPREIEKNAINAANSTNTTTASVVNHQKPAATSPNVINTTNKSNIQSKDIVDDVTIPITPPTKPISSSPPATPPTPPKAKTRKSKQQQQPEQNCIVFKFTDRKDVPDYIGNDGMVRTQSRIDIPKAGEGGITLLPGTTIQDVYKDYDEELMSLEGPPSPCDVNFINDNILIDGKSSLSKKSKKAKGRIQFVEAIPQVFEYPSEASMLLDDPKTLDQPLGGTTVPSLSGSTLANYTPKAASNDFQLGVTKAPPPPPPTTTDKNKENDEVIDPEEEPMMFSSGTNSDILF